jgi:hypothetical protein
MDLSLQKLLPKPYRGYKVKQVLSALKVLRGSVDYVVLLAPRGRWALGDSQAPPAQMVRPR